MQLSIGFSPCPNDTFMLEALMHSRIQSSGIQWEARIADVETLNEWALAGELDVTKLSFGTWIRVSDQYDLIPSGAALGRGCGPLVIARAPLTETELCAGPIAIPGKYTTANLLFSMRYPNARNKVAMIFSEIEAAVLSGEVVAGVIIHENRFTYAAKGLVRLLDLGEYWEEETKAPLPLGGFAIRQALGKELRDQVALLIKQSVTYGFEHPDVVMPYVRQHAQEMDDTVMRAHINTYVNEFSLDLGSEGQLAIETLVHRAQLVTPF